MTEQLKYTDGDYEIERTPFTTLADGTLIHWKLRRSLDGVLIARGEAKNQSDAEDQIQAAIDIEYYRTKS